MCATIRTACVYFSNFGSLKSTETVTSSTSTAVAATCDFSNFGSLKSTETLQAVRVAVLLARDFSNFGSLKSTETTRLTVNRSGAWRFQQFRLVEEH